MENYNFGYHYDPLVSGYLDRNFGKAGDLNSPDSFAVSTHFYVSSGSSSDRNFIFRSQAPAGTGNSVSMILSWGTEEGQDVSLVYFHEWDVSVTVPRPSAGTYARFVLIKDPVNGPVSMQMDTGDGLVDYGEVHPDGFVSTSPYWGGGDTFFQLSSIMTHQDFGSGWVKISHFDPDLVPNSSGGLVSRLSSDAVPESVGRIYDIMDPSSYYEAETPNQAAFVARYDVVDVNGGTIELGETGVEVTMSNEITLTDLYFTDGNKEYRPTYSQSGATFTFDVPLASDDTIPKFGTLDLVIVDADGTYSKTFEFAPPTGYELVTLENPIELDESSYTFGTGLNPITGDHYFHQPTTDFSISVNNVLTPVGDAPWSHTVWYLSGAGLRETEVSDGQVVVDPNDPPTVDAGAPRTATVGDTVQFGTNVTITEGDGTIDSLLWTQQAGPTVSINNAGVKNASATFSQAGSYEFPLTATDSNGETGSDVLYITVNEAVTDSTLNATITNIPDGTYDTRVLSTAGDVLFFGPKAWASESASFTLTDVPAGTNVEYYVIGATDGGIDRGVTE